MAVVQHDRCSCCMLPHLYGCVLGSSAIAGATTCPYVITSRACAALTCHRCTSAPVPAYCLSAGTPPRLPFVAQVSTQSLLATAVSDDGHSLTMSRGQGLFIILDARLYIVSEEPPCGTGEQAVTAGCSCVRRWPLPGSGRRPGAGAPV